VLKLTLKKNNLFNFFLLNRGMQCISLFFLLVSCSTILTGTKSEIFIDSEPGNAEVRIAGLSIGKTPVRFRLEKSFDGVVTIQKEGFEKSFFTIPKSFNAVSVLNTIFIYAWIIDIATGSIRKFDNKTIGINLKEKNEN